MTMRPTANSRGFTLVELMISMSLGTVVMLAVFSTYNYLGRNLTKLSYRHILESQSRKILTSLAGDIRKTKSIAAASATALNLRLIDGSSVDYTFNAGTGKISRDPDGAGPAPAAILNYDIGDANVQVPVTLPNFSFTYYTTTGNAFTVAGTGPTYQNTTTIVPKSIKQVVISFTLQAGTTAIQGQQGTLTTYPVTSNRQLFVNRSMPDGS
jgi:prepilin-type N-terminal cleavage/methylation domain-containing protein